VKLSRRAAGKPGRTGSGDGEAAAHGGSLGGWRERRALPLLVAVPVVALAALATGRAISSAQDITAYQHVHYLAETGESVLGLAQALEIERTDTAQFVVLGPLYGGRGAQRSSAEYLLEKRVMQRTYSATDKRAAQVMRRAGAIGGSYPALVRAEAREEVTAIRGLGNLRLAATSTELSGLAVNEEYTSVIEDVLGFSKYTALPGHDADLAQTVRVLSLVSQMKEEESRQAAILTSGLTPNLVSLGPSSPVWLAAITSSIAAQKTDAQAFSAEATAAQARQYNSVLSGAPVERASTEEAVAVAAASGSGAPAGPTAANASTGLGYQFNGLRVLEAKLSSSAASQATARHGAAEASIAVFSALLAALALLLALIFHPRLRRRRPPAG
jgi:hypothetical protein